jgi:hypothetical protein
MKTFHLFLCAIPVLFCTLAVDARAQQLVTFPSGDSTAQALL